jgi:hypothetical protein
MKRTTLLIVTLLLVFQANAQTTIFNDLLQEHVTKDGIVDYKNFDSQKLKKYITYLEDTAPDISWSENKQKAFWINAYNAYTIYLILHAVHAEKITSIMDIKKEGKTAWKIPFAKVGGTTYTLDHIEHEILRKTLFDPRIHVGVNCASNSCPKLGNVAFTEENIEVTLEQLMKDFINNPNSNKISTKKIQISSIFDWFQEDFTKKTTVIDYLNKYSETKINSNAKVSYLKYDWSLNGK